MWQKIETKSPNMESYKNKTYRINVYVTTGTITVQPLIGRGVKVFRGEILKNVMELYA